MTIHPLSPSIVLVASGTVPAAAHWPAPQAAPAVLGVAWCRSLRR